MLPHNDELESISLLLKTNKLSLKKTTIYISKRKAHDFHSGHQIDNQHMNKVKKKTVLGVVIDSKLSWKKTYLSSGWKIIEEY